MISRILTLAVLLGPGGMAQAQTPPPSTPAHPPLARFAPPPLPPLCAEPGAHQPARHAPSVKMLQKRLHIDAARAKKVRSALAEHMRKQEALNTQTCSQLEQVVGAGALKRWEAMRMPPPPPAPPAPPSPPRPPAPPANCDQ